MAENLDDLRDVAMLAGRADNVIHTLGAALDALAEVIAYDLAAVLVLDGERLVVRCARGSLATPQVERHEIDLTRAPELREAIRSGRPRAFTEAEHDHARGGEGDAFQGVVELPHGHACLVAPLIAGGRTIGAMTFDRSVCQRYDERTIALVTVYAQLVAMALELANRNRDLERRSESLAERARTLAAATPEGPGAEVFARSDSSAMAEVVTLAKRVAPTSAAVLITGEHGTGKEVAARAIHAWSRRAGEPFLALSCALRPDQALESELFGHVREAFPGAERDRIGRLGAVDGGTLLLDDIGELPLAAQGRLLQVLQEGRFAPTGSVRTSAVDVRIIAASATDLPQAVAAGRFRRDLYHRLAVFPLHLPPLRERREDLPRLAQELLMRIGRRHRAGGWSLLSETLNALAAYPWPGNVTELEQTLDRAAVLAGPGGAITVRHLSFPGAAHLPSAVAPTLEDTERTAISAALAACRGKVYGVNGAAARLGLPPSTLQHRMRKLGLGKPAP